MCRSRARPSSRNRAQLDTATLEIKFGAWSSAFRRSVALLTRDRVNAELQTAAESTCTEILLRFRALTIYCFRGHIEQSFQIIRLRGNMALRILERIERRRSNRMFSSFQGGVRVVTAGEVARRGATGKQGMNSRSIASERVSKIARSVLRRGEVSGFVAPRFQISCEYAPSSRLAMHPAALAIPYPIYFQNTLSATHGHGCAFKRTFTFARRLVRNHLINTRNGVEAGKETINAKYREQKKWGGVRSLGRPRRCWSVTGRCGHAPSSRLVAGPNLWPRHLRLFMR